MKGIMFLPQFFPAIDEGRKTMTRRLMKPTNRVVKSSDDGQWYDADGINPGVLLKPRYLPGETVYVKEGWACRSDIDPKTELKKALHYLLYRADGGDLTDEWHDYGKWRNAMFMPEWAARRFIRITAVRAERLQDISEANAKREGAEETIILPGDRGSFIPYFRNLWDEINGAGSWDVNPYIFCYGFERVDRP